MSNSSVPPAELVRTAPGGERPGGERPGGERPRGASLDPDEFSAMVAAVTSAFGDPTRRDIYLYARGQDGITATEVAERFELHPNVARHHLDKLAAGGYLEVSRQGEVTGSSGLGGAGRPSKRYRTPTSGASDSPLAFPPRRDDLLVMLLAEALQLLDPQRAETMAESVGEEYGRTLAHQLSPGDGQRSVQSALNAVADALTAHGFAAHAEARGASLAVVAANCPFGGAASVHPVLCAVDRGMVRGMLAGLHGSPIPVTMSSRARGDESCTAVV
ncbi:MAG: helix-turn-helix transcriptional regulator [Acidimicrobiales bacterium]